MNIGEGALVSRTTQLSRDALTRVLGGTDVHLPHTIPDPRGKHSSPIPAVVDAGSTPV